MENTALFGTANHLWGVVDENSTVKKTAGLSQQIGRTARVARGVFDTKQQPMDVFYARHLLAEVKQTIRNIGDHDPLLGEILNFILFQKGSYGNLTDAGFYVEHGMSEKTYYRMRKKALLMFANDFNAGELLVFKNHAQENE